MDEPFWQWSKEMPRPRRGSLPATSRQGAQAVYFPACISRIMGALPGEPDDINDHAGFLNIAGRAKISLYVPPDLRGNCCGVPFSSKGFEAAHAPRLITPLRIFPAGPTTARFRSWLTPVHARMD